MSKQTENLKLHLYDTGDKFNITADNNSLNNNMELIDAAISSKADVELAGGVYSATVSEICAGSYDNLVVGNKYLMTYEPAQPFIFYANATDMNSGTVLCVVRPVDSSITPNHITLQNSIIDYGTQINGNRVAEVEIQKKSNDFIQFHITSEPVIIKTLSDKQDKLSQFAEDRTNNIAQITAEQLDLKRVVINYSEVPYNASYKAGSGHALDTLYTVSDFTSTGSNEYSVMTNGSGGFNFICANQLNIPIGTNIKIQLSDEYTDPTTIEAATSAIRNGSGPVKIKLIVIEENESIANMPINGVSTITSNNLSLLGGSDSYGSSLDLSDRTAALASYSNILLNTNSGKITLSGSEIELLGDTIKLIPNSTAPTNPVKLLNVATPTNGTDAANKAYVDSLIGSGGSGGMDPRYGTISENSSGDYILTVGINEMDEDYNYISKSYTMAHAANSGGDANITFDESGLELWGTNKLQIKADSTIEILNYQSPNFDAVKIGSADAPYYIGALGIGKNNGPTRMTIEDQNIRLTTGVSGSIGIKNSVDTANMADAEIALDTTTNTTYIQTKELVLFRPHHTMSEGNTEMLVRSGSGPIRITGLAAPKNDNDAATKAYVDAAIAAALNK